MRDAATGNGPAVNLGVDVVPALTELVGSLLVPVQVKVPLVVHLEHSLADGPCRLQLVVHAAEHLLLLVRFCLPLLQFKIDQIVNRLNFNCRYKCNFLFTALYITQQDLKKIVVVKMNLR